jgi:hypothetical protein
VPITDLLDWPGLGIRFDVGYNSFWVRNWGAKPDDPRDADRVAQAIVETAPRLIPVFSHRFLPTEPPIEGNPVLSVHQADIIYYGSDLGSYWISEFKLPIATEDKPPRRISFWSDVIDEMNSRFESERVNE